MGGFEIIDLCSDSDSDSEHATAAAEEGPARKKTKKKLLDTAAVSRRAVEGRREGITASGVGNSGTSSAAGNGIFRGVTWKRSHPDGSVEGPVKDDDDDDDDPGQRAAPATPVIRGATQVRRVEPGSGTESAGAVRQMQTTPLAQPRHGTEAPHIIAANDTEASGKGPNSSHPSPSNHDEITVVIEDLSPFTVAQNTGLDTTKPAIPRIETVRTETGTKKRKMIGPFVLDDDDIDDGGGGGGGGGDEIVCDFPEDGEYAATDLKFLKTNSIIIISNVRKDSGIGAGSGPGADAGSNSTSASNPRSPSPLSPPRKKTKVDEMELYQRRRKSEDKCAQVSRTMREEAIAKRRAGVKGSQGIGSSRGLLEESPSPEVNWPASRLGIQRGVMDSTSAGNGCESKQNRFSDEDEDDLFGDGTPSLENIEAQLDFAPSPANRIGNAPSPKDLSRSCRPFTSTSGVERADFAEKSDLQRNDGEVLLHDSTQHSEKQLPNGEARNPVTSGIEHYDREQAEKYWVNVNKEERRKKKKKKKRPKKIEFERDQTGIVPPSTGRGGPTNMMDGIRGKDEARLLTAKEPLKAAPNVNGLLPQLVQKTAAKPGGPSDFLRDAKGTQPPSSPTHRGLDSMSPDAGVWTKNGTVRERKRDIENLMSAFTESAKCCNLAFDSLSQHYQKLVKSDVHKLKEFAGPILRGYSFRDKVDRRIAEIRKNMTRRTERYEKTNRTDGGTSQGEIDLTLVDLMGPERFRRGKKLLDDVLAEYQKHQTTEKGRSRSKRDSSRRNNDSGPLKRTSQPSMSHQDVEDLQSQSDADKADAYEGVGLNRQAQAAWQRLDAREKQLREKHSLYERLAQRGQRDESTKRVSFADEGLWDEARAEARLSQSVESDEDEDETAPSFGRDGDSISTAPRSPAIAVAAAPARRSFGGKGLISELRQMSEERPVPRNSSGHRPMARKGDPARKRKSKPMSNENVELTRRIDVGGKSISMAFQQKPRDQLTTQIDSSESEEFQCGSGELDSEAEDSFVDTEDASGIYDDMHVIQYDIVAAYDSFDDYKDASSVRLGTHIDVNAALRQMNRVTRDVAASASRKYRQVRLIWDTDDFELAAQTVILPTGGECRVCMVKSWAPVTSWPGKERAKAVAVPKVVYVVHETKTTSLRPPPPCSGDAKDDELFGPEDFKDPQPVIEKERDMCLSSRQCANGIAKNRLMAFNSKHDAGEEAEGRASNAELAEYMEQIEHDKVCFEQEKRVWTKRDDRKGKEEIKIWVEEMLVDMPI